MSIDQVLFQIRKKGEKPFRLAYVRSTGKSIGSTGSGLFVFADFIDTNQDIIKCRDNETGVIKTLKISHILSYENHIIQR
jgi:hypothetical protein